jgi:hypothetical protein
MDDDIVWHQTQGLPHGGTYHGLSTVREKIFAPIEGGRAVRFHQFTDTPGCTDALAGPD